MITKGAAPLSYMAFLVALAGLGGLQPELQRAIPGVRQQPMATSPRNERRLSKKRK